MQLCHTLINVCNEVDYKPKYQELSIDWLQYKYQIMCASVLRFVLTFIKYRNIQKYAKYGKIKNKEVSDNSVPDICILNKRKINKNE